MSRRKRKPAPKPPAITVVTPSFNQARFLEKPFTFEAVKRLVQNALA